MNAGKKRFYIISLIAICLLLFFTVEAKSNNPCFDCHSDIKVEIHSVLACTECHQDLQNISNFPHKAPLLPVDCGSCHGDLSNEYEKSLHGVALKKGVSDAPRCKSCHGTHDIKSKNDSTSQTARSNIPDICGKCHGSLKFVERQKGILSANPYIAYRKSIHGEAIAGGATKAAICTDCHGSHNLKPPNDENSLVSKKNIASTCGKCHYGIYKVFEESIHGKAARAGVSDAPTCTDCHGIHAIKSHINPKSSVSEAAISITTCPKCHGEGSVIEKPCRNCKGAGLERTRKRLQVKIPPGADEGQSLRLRSEGNAAQGGRPGDLYVRVHLKPHRSFKRQGDDVLYETRISFPKAVLGGELEVPCIDGRARLKIPPGTSSGTIFKLEGKGFPHLEGWGRGNQLVRVDVDIPHELSKRQQELLMEFAREIGEKL